MGEIYLDNSATTRVIPEAVEAMCTACTYDFGNPSSLHGKGHSAEKILKQTREDIAAEFGCRPEEVYFTSGGTESNNWAILGTARKRARRGRHIVITKIEHPSVLNVCKYLENNGFEVSYVPPGNSGMIDVEKLKDCIRQDTILVSVMHVNNETGVIQPIDQIGRLLKELNEEIVFHVDGVQSFGKLSLDLEGAHVDLLSVSAHKIHGPKGTGALFMRRGREAGPFLLGGEQEQQRRAGTENVPGIAGFGAAVRAAGSIYRSSEKVTILKERLLEGLKQRIPEVLVNGSPKGSIPYIMNLSIPGIKGEVLVHYLEQYNIFISTGSACHSRAGHASHVLEAMGVRGARLEGAVRISFSHFNTPEEIDYTVEKMALAVKDLYSLR